MSISKLLSFINSYHNTKFTLVDRLMGGYQDGVYRLIEPNGDQAVLKGGFAKYAVNAVNQLYQIGYPVPALRYAGFTNDGTPYWIQTFVEGQPLETVTEDYLEQILALNDLQANLNSHTSGQSDQSWSRYAHQVVFANESGWNATIRMYSTETETFLKMLEETSLPFAAVQLPEADVVHGDFIPDNILVHNGKITGVIDIAYAGYGTRVIDLATLLHYAYLYDYSTLVRTRLEKRIKQISEVGVYTVCLVYRIMAMLAWAIEHHSASAVEGYINKSRDMLHHIS